MVIFKMQAPFKSLAYAATTSAALIALPPIAAAQDTVPLFPIHGERFYDPASSTDGFDFQNDVCQRRDILPGLKKSDNPLAQRAVVFCARAGQWSRERQAEITKAPLDVSISTAHALFVRFFPRGINLYYSLSEDGQPIMKHGRDNPPFRPVATVVYGLPLHKMNGRLPRYYNLFGDMCRDSQILDQFASDKRPTVWEMAEFCVIGKNLVEDERKADQAAHAAYLSQEQAAENARSEKEKAAPSAAKDTSGTGKGADAQAPVNDEWEKAKRKAWDAYQAASEGAAAHTSISLNNKASQFYPGGIEVIYGMSEPGAVKDRAKRPVYPLAHAAVRLNLKHH